MLLYSVCVLFSSRRFVPSLPRNSTLSKHTELETTQVQQLQESRIRQITTTLKLQNTYNNTEFSLSQILSSSHY